MSAVPGAVDTEQSVPLTVPLRHFLVGIGFLFAATLVGVGLAADAVPGLGTLVRVHLLLAGWVCVTIMGAMTQFVPVWSGTDLYSLRLANAQLALVAAGLTGFVAALALSALPLLIAFGALMLAGFWTFAYNIGRTLVALDSRDVTERHFLYALGFFLALTSMGILLAVDFTYPVLDRLPFGHGDLRNAHATVAVFGAVLTTVYGALYQLGTMFTQTELHGVDEQLQSAEELCHPLGVALLAVGRLADWAPLARVGAALVLLAALAVALVIGRKLVEMRVERTPMHTRYAVAVAALALWALSSAPAWLTDPTASAHLFGSAAGVHLLTLGAIGFVVFGTLYHIVPFIIWVERYSDLLGFEEVPMIDDLYDDRLAAADGSLLFAGVALLVAADWLGLSAVVMGAGGALVALGVAVFATNMVLVVRRHGPDPLDRVLLGSLSPRRESSSSIESSAESPAGDR